jgi:hypothetical protein
MKIKWLKDNWLLTIKLNLMSIPIGIGKGGAMAEILKQVTNLLSQSPEQSMCSCNRSYLIGFFKKIWGKVLRNVSISRRAC